ncbi:MAG: aminopeptidase P family protein [Sphingomonadales bacterium]|nr:aminopeptidase P family protein [Sphingomonadales bacterium]MDE2168236.1 aminopeptidase P family protein [Sphingomonadales bacterium]
MTASLTDTVPSPREAVGAVWSIEAMRAAQARSWEALHRIAAMVRPGMTEAEATAQGKVILSEMGMELAWHPLLIRFGTNTLKIFSDTAPGDMVLGQDDIWFVDMGPVFGGHEGDAGATFTTGHDPAKLACARDVKLLFDRVKTIWDGGAVTGEDLYRAAQTEAEALGWVLNLDIQGHRVGDYPHSVHKGGQLGRFDQTPNPGLWILEMQIRHPILPFGGFYEDLLA